MRYLATIMLVLTLSSAPGQTKIIDSLKNELDQKTIIDESYVDLVNEISFQYLLADPSSANEWITRGAILSDSLNYKRGTVRAVVNKGSSYWTVGLFDMALAKYLEAISLGADSVTYIILCNNIGEVFKKKRQYDSSFHYYFKGMQVAEKIPWIFPAMLPANIGETYFIIGKYDSARHYYQQSYDSASKQQNDRSVAYALSGLGDIAYQEGRFEKAIENHLRALEIRRSINDKRGIIQSLQTLGKYELESPAPSKALTYFNEAEELSNEVDAKDLLSQTFKLKAEYHRKTADFEKAIKYLTRHQSLKDSVEVVEFSNNIENIKAALNSEVRETENKLLTEQQKKHVNSLKIQGVMLTVIIFIVIVLIVLLNKYFKSLQYSKQTSINLDKLNKVILNKNKEIKDINERLDQQLLTTNRLLSESERLSKLGGWNYDIETGEMYWTDEMYRQLQLDPSEVMPSLKVLRKRLGKQEYHKIQLALRNLIKEKKPQNTDVFLKTVRSSKTLSIKLIPEFRDGKLYRIYGSNHDITEAINTEKKEVTILQTLFRLSKMANLKEVSFKTFIEDLLRESAVTLEVERVSFWLYNKEEKAIFCYSRYNHTDGSFHSDDIMKEQDYPIYFSAMKQNRVIAAHDAFKDERTTEFTSSYLLKNHIRSIMDARILLHGELLGVVCFEKTVTPVTWSYSDQRFAGTISELISNAFSISQNLQLEKEKGELIKRLLKRNQNLKEFAYVVSHNLRDPVTQILGLSSIYDKPAGEDLSDEIIPRIRTSAGNLDKVIKDLTMVLRQQEDSKEAPQDTLLIEGFELAKSNIEAEVKAINPKINLQFDNDFTLTIQPSVLFNILYNLLSNSLKYRKDEGELEITLTAESAEESDIITFRDNGKGIDLERFGEKMFKMYERFHLDIEGNGLGLYLVKNQIENMGGSIEVKSKPGEGTTFIIKLPNNESHLSKEPGKNIIQHFVS